MKFLKRLTSLESRIKAVEQKPNQVIINKIFNSLDTAQVKNGQLILKMLDGREINAGVVKGESGEGLNGRDGRDGIDAMGLNGIDGQDGKSIELIRDENSIGWKYQDSQEVNHLISINELRGKKGKDGKDGLHGRGIVNIDVQRNGDILVELTDGEIIHVGRIRIIMGGGGISLAALSAQAPISYNSAAGTFSLNPLVVSDFASPDVSQWTNDAGYITSGSISGLVPYIGATADVDLGAHTITASNFSGSSSGTNTGDQTITLTGDVTGSGIGSFVTTLATVNTNIGSFGSSTAIPNFTVNAKGLITAAGTNVVIAPAGTLTGTTLASNVVTSSITTLGTSASLPGSPTTTTQASTDNSTKISTTAYVTTAISNAIAGVNPAVAVQAATTQASDTSGFTYNNGVSGIGATLTGSVNTAVTIDGYTFTALGQRLLVKNDTQSPSGAFNGVYYVTQVQTVLLAPILTRALDYDMPSDINNTGAIPVVNGTVNSTTSWLLTSSVNTVGTDPLTYIQFSIKPSSVLTNTLTNAHILVGNGSNIATDVAMSGDATIANTGAVTVAHAPASGLTGTTLPSGVVNSSLTSLGLLAALNVDSVATIGANSTTTISINMGNTAGGFSTAPLLNFHTGTTPVSYDSRIYANGGNGSIGGGQIVIEALALALNSTVITSGTWNGGVIGSAYGGTGIANNAASTITISGNFGTTFTVTGTTSVTLPTSGTLTTLSTVISTVNDYTAQQNFAATTLAIGDLVTNGSFASGASWTLEAGWTISGGLAHSISAGKNMSQSITLTSGKQYIATITLANYSAGLCYIRLGGTIGAGISGNGTTTQTITAGASTPTLQIRSDGGGFTSDVSNVTVQLYEVDIDLNTNQECLVNLTSNKQINAPTNMKNGGRYVISFLQDSTGSRTVTLNSVFKNCPTFSTAANALDILEFYSDGTNMYCIGYRISTTTLLNSGNTLNLTQGGTNASLVASNGGIFYSTASAGAILSGTATASKMLLSGASTTPTWSTSTIPTSAGATANKLLLSDGTNYVLSTPTFPNASATAGKHIVSDGTNWIASTPTFPNTSGTAGKVIISDGTNNVYSTPTYPNASVTAGKLIRSDGTNYAASTSTFADTYTASNLLYSNGANTVAGLTTANNGIVKTDGSGVPSVSSTLPTAVQGNITSLGTVAACTGLAMQGTYTNTSQPAFLAILGTTVLNACGKSTTTWQLGTTTALTKIFDQGSNLNTNGTFTAPVTGRYCFSGGILVDNLNIASQADLILSTSNRIIRLQQIHRAAAAFNLDPDGTVLVDMDAADTAVLQIIIGGEATDRGAVYGDPTNPYTYFSGFLVC